MGLDFSHCDAHWSYTGFNHFRCRVASIIMETEKTIDRLYDERMIYRYLMNEPIYPFIDHSDCDGKLTPDELKQIIPQLEDAVSKIEDVYDKENGEKLLKGMRLALKNNEDLRFH